MRRLWRLVLGVGVFVLLPACGMRVWVEVEIADDSSGTVTMQIASDQALREGLAAFSPDVDPVAQLSGGLEERDWLIEEAPPDGEWEGVIATHDFADLGELAGLLDEAVQGGGASVEIVETSDAYSLSAELGPPADDANQADLIQQASEVIDLDGRLRVRFPAEVIETNGEISESGDTVTWTYDEESLAGFAVHARATKPGSAVPWMLGVLVVAAVGGAVVASRRRTKPQVEG